MKLLIFLILIFWTQGHNSELGSNMTYHKVYIESNYNNAEIFFDDKKVGKGKCLVDSVTKGSHTILVKRRKLVYKKNITIKNEQKTYVNAWLGKEKNFHFTLTYMNLFVKSFRARGAQLNLGIQVRKNYFGISAHWAPNRILWQEYRNMSEEIYIKGTELRVNEISSLGGAGLEWKYEFYNLNNNIKLFVGNSYGFWKYEGEQHIVAQPLNSEMNTNELQIIFSKSKYIDRYFISSALIELLLKYKSIAITVSYNTMIGNTIGHNLLIGTSLIF